MRKLKLDELNRDTLNEFVQKEKHQVSILLDNVRSALNVGSAFRTADAFAIKHIFLTGITATPPSREMNKTAIGATESVAWSYSKEVSEVLSKAREKGIVILAVEQTDQSQDLGTYTFDPEKEYLLIFGNEVDGVSDPALNYCDGALEVPQFGTKHSLNVSVCVGVCLYKVVSQLRS